MRESSVENMIGIAEEIINVLEKKCVCDSEVDFALVLQEEIAYDARYLRRVFSFVTEMSLSEYVRRRRLSQVFLKIENFDNIALHETVSGIKSFKKKFLNEFSAPGVFELNFWDTHKKSDVARRVEWKWQNHVRKRCVCSGRVVLFDLETDLELDFSFWEFKGLIFCFEASVGDKVNQLWSWLFKIPVVSTNETCTIASLCADICRVLCGESISNKNAGILKCSFYGPNDSFGTCSLVNSWSGPSRESVDDVTLSKYLLWDGKKLIFEADSFFDEKYLLK